MSELELKDQVLVPTDKIEKAESSIVSRPSNRLIGFQLNRSLRTGNLGQEPRSKIQDGSVDRYNGFKVKDIIESLYAGAIVALSNAVMDAYGEAAQSGRFRDQNLGRAFEGTSILIDLMTAFETRRDLRKQDDPASRANALEAVLKQIDLRQRIKR